ncbi:MAG: hypothetical protein ACK4PN_08380 [Allorhizobium sp.]
MTNKLTLADISVFNGEPAILDLRLAEILGYEKTYNIRELIKRNIDELLQYGQVCSTVEQTDSADEGVFPTVGKTSAKGDGVFRTVRKTPSKGGRPGTAYHLNEHQAMTVAVLSKTDNAAHVRKELITVFLAYRNGTLLAPPRPADMPAPVDEMTRKLAMVTEARMTHGPAFAAALWRQLGLPEPGRLLPPPPDAEALECLRHLLRASHEAETVGALLDAAFKGDRDAAQKLKSLKIEIKGDGFTVPNVHADFAALYEETRWQRPFEHLRRLPGAKPHMPYGGRFAGEYTFVPSHYLDEA